MCGRGVLLDVVAAVGVVVVAVLVAWYPVVVVPPVGDVDDGCC